MQLDLPRAVGKPIRMLYVELDGTGVPVVKQETLDRKGKKEGEPAHTREVKLGCVFTQTRWDKEGWKRGWSRAKKKVVLGDGAEWIWNLAQQHFPGAVQIVDLYHARQHLWELVRQLYPHDEV